MKITLLFILHPTAACLLLSSSQQSFSSPLLVVPSAQPQVPWRLQLMASLLLTNGRSLLEDNHFSHLTVTTVEMKMKFVEMQSHARADMWPGGLIMGC